MKEILVLVLQGSVLLLIFALGLASRMGDAMYLFRRPGLLLRSVVAIDVVVPAVAVLFVFLLPLAPLVKLAIVLMAVSPVPPLVPAKQLRLGAKTGYACGLYIAVSLLAIAIVPLTMAILSAVLPRDAWIAPAAVARVVVLSVLLPLAAGMAVRRLRPGLAERAAPIVSKVATLLLLLGFVPILVAAWPAVRPLLGNGAALAIAGVVGAGLLAGHLLGGPDREDRTALAVASATRHPGTAFLIARTSFPAENTAPAVLLFLVIGIVAALPFQVWGRKLAAGLPAEASG